MRIKKPSGNIIVQPSRLNTLSPQELAQAEKAFAKGKFRAAANQVFGKIGPKSQRNNTINFSMGPARETWDRVHDQPSMIVEDRKTRNAVNQKLKTTYLNNEDMRKYKELRREEKIEMKAMLTQTFWGRDKAWNNLMSHRESQRSGKISNHQSKQLLEAISSGQ